MCVCTRAHTHTCVGERELLNTAIGKLASLIRSVPCSQKLFMFRALKPEAEIAAVGNLSRRSLSVCNRFMTVYSTMDYIGGGAERGKGRKSPLSKHSSSPVIMFLYICMWCSVFFLFGHRSLFHDD